MKISHSLNGLLLCLAFFYSAEGYSQTTASSTVETSDQQNVIENSASYSPTKKQLPTVTVYGEKTKRSVQDTASSVQVYNDERIETLGNMDELSDILKANPNINYTSTGAIPSVRGVDGSGPARRAVAFLAGSRPRLNVSLDGRSIDFNELTFGPKSLWDLEQTEVFLGPQSYIQGRNAIAGAVVMQSKDPTYEWEGKLKLSGGSQEHRQAAVVLSGPILNDELAFRISADRQQRYSHIELEEYEPAGDPREIHSNSARLKLLYEPSSAPDFMTRLSINHTETRAPQNEMDIVPTSRLASGPRPILENHSNSTIWDIAYEQSNNISVENKLIFTDFTYNRITVPRQPFAKIKGTEKIIEPLLRFNSNNFKGLVGLHHFNKQQQDDVNIFGGATFDDSTEITAAFGEIAFNLSSSVEAKIAARHESEKRKRSGKGKGQTIRGRFFNVEIDLDETYEAFLPKLDIAWKPSKQHTLGFTTGKGYRSGGAGITFDLPWKSFAFEPEYVLNHELYSRHRFNDSFSLNANIFYNDYNDMQLPYFLSPNAVTIVNAEKAHTYGAELGMDWQATNALALFTNVGLLRTKIDAFKFRNYVDNQLASAPKTSANIGFQYQPINGLTVNVNGQYRSAYYSSFDNIEAGKIDQESWVGNAKITYAQNNWSASVFANNFSDTQHEVSRLYGDFVPIREKPRLLGASVEVGF